MRHSQGMTRHETRPGEWLIKTMARLSLLALIGLAVPAFAGPVGIQRQPVQDQPAIAQLEAAKAEVRQRELVPTVKGPLRLCYMNKQEQIDTLIDRLHNGQRVSSGAIDRAAGSC